MTLDEEERRRRDRRMPRSSIRKYKESPFHYLYNSLNDQSLLNATGCDHRTFNILLMKFQPFYDYYTFDEKSGDIRKKKCFPDGTPRGRKRDMTAVGCLGLVLMWFRTKGACTKSLALHFGQTSTPMYRWLKFGRRVLLKSLINENSTRLEVPSADKIKLFCEAIGDRYPVLPVVWDAWTGLG